MDVDVYYSGAWHNIHSGTVTKNTWVELSVGSTQTVDKARIKTNDSTASRRIREFYFNEVSGGQTHYGAATLSGTGALAAIGAKTLAGAATLAGTGSFAAAAVKVLTGAATLAGEGALATIGTIEGAIKYGAATLAGTGSLAAAAVATLTATAMLAGEGALAAIGCKILTGATTLAGSGALAAIGSLLGDVLGSATLAGQGSISVIAESWHLLTGQEYQDLLEGQIEFQEI